MGMYPGAEIFYGIDLGPDEDLEFIDGIDREDAEETVKAADPMVSLGYYGHLESGYRLSFLATHVTRVDAYDAVTIEPAALAVDTTEWDRALDRAWSAVFPGTKCPKPGWRVVVQYG